MSKLGKLTKLVLVTVLGISAGVGILQTKASAASKTVTFGSTGVSYPSSFKSNGKLKGFNTDGYGFTQSARDAGCDVKGRTITVMGVGGAGMAICGQSALEGAKKIHVFARPTSRYWERAAAMAEKMSHMTECEMILHEMDDHTALKDALEESNLLINATSVGMVPDVTGTVIPDKALFHPELTVADVVYEPRETRLLREAREAGCPTFNGMYMLLHQGVKAFHIWTGLDMPVELIREKYFK